ncbi:MAG: hypothetical protein RR667_06660, partial [Muribaculaceae bacterium]
LRSLKLRVRDNRIKNEEKRIAKIESGVTEDRAIIEESKERNRDLILSKLKEDSRVEEVKDGRYWFKGDDARFYIDKTGNILAIEYKHGISKLEKRIARESLTNEHSALYEEISKDLKSKGLLLDSTESELRVSEADKAVSEVREEISSIYEESRMYRKASDEESREAEEQKPFHDMIDDLFSGNPIDKSKYARTYFHVAEAPDFMKKIGLIGAEFTIPFKAISIHLSKDTEHKMTSTEWHGLSEAIKSPFLITSYGKKKDRFRLYTNLLFNGNPIVVGVDVKRINQGVSKPQLEINSIKTVFAKSNKISPEEQVVCYDKRLTPEQVALLNGHNFRQYPTIQELSFDKDNNAKDWIQENSVKNDTMYRAGEFTPASEAEIGEAVRVGKSLGMEVEVVNEPGSE